MSEPPTTESGPANKPVDREALRRNHHRNMLSLGPTVVTLALTLPPPAAHRCGRAALPCVLCLKTIRTSSSYGSWFCLSGGPTRLQNGH